MSQEAIKELLGRMRHRYRRAGKAYKGRLLDEFCDYTGYSRKYACKLLNSSAPKRKASAGRKKVYNEEVKQVLKVIWLTSDQLCSKLLKPVIALYLPGYERLYGPLDEALKEKLLRISPATIDRLLRPERLARMRSRRARIRNPVREAVPLRCEAWDVEGPGWMEFDTVAHCGGSMRGNFVWTLTGTDIFSGWTECRAVWNRGAQAVRTGFGEMEKDIPFALRGADFDNGSEFLNWHLHDYLLKREKPVEMTRSRPYHKNDNAHVEQKNFTHVRRLLGYERFEEHELVEKINRIYEVWIPFKNFFAATFRLKEKQRVGAKYKRAFEVPRTPYQRLMESDRIAPETRKRLRDQFEALDPFELKAELERRLKEVFTHETRERKVSSF